MRKGYKENYDKEIIKYLDNRSFEAFVLKYDFVFMLYLNYKNPSDLYDIKSNELKKLELNFLCFLERYFNFIFDEIKENFKDSDFENITDYVNLIELKLSFVYSKKAVYRVDNIDEFPFYCQIGALFAQGFILQKKNNFFYKNEQFDSISQLSKHIQGVLKTKKETKPYINSTLTGYGIKNFYNSFIKMNRIIKYCEYQKIAITHDFENKFTNIQKIELYKN